MLISNSCNTSCCKFFCGCGGIITPVLHKSDRLEHSSLILAPAPANPCASEVQLQKDVFTVSVSLHSQTLCSPPDSWSKKGWGWGGCGSLGVSQCIVWLEQIAFSKDIIDQPGLLQLKQTGFGQRLSTGEKWFIKEKERNMSVQYTATRRLKLKPKNPSTVI